MRVGTWILLASSSHPSNIQQMYPNHILHHFLHILLEQVYGMLGDKWIPRAYSSLPSTLLHWFHGHILHLYLSKRLGTWILLASSNLPSSIHLDPFHCHILLLYSYIEMEQDCGRHGGRLILPAYNCL